jgi:hypothetical protein
MKNGIADFECKVVKMQKQALVHCYWTPSFWPLCTAVPA